MFARSHALFTRLPFGSMADRVHLATLHPSGILSID
jgi:hypothetical protein